MIAGIVLAAALLAPPDRPCERPAYELEDRANQAEHRADFAAVSRDREAAARIYLRCRPKALRPERESFWAGIDDVIAGEFAWATYASLRGCRLFHAGDALMLRAAASDRLTKREREIAAPLMEEASHDRRDGGSRWYPDRQPRPCS